MTAIAPQIPAVTDSGQVALNRLHCANCGRPLRHPVFMHGAAYGATCAKALFGPAPAALPAERHTTPDERQAELFPALWARVQSAIRRAHVWLGGAA